MTGTQILLILVVAIPLLLVALDRIRMDLAALAIATLLGLMQFAGLEMLGKAGAPAEALKAVSGFGQPVIIILISLFMITRGLENIGITRWVADQILQAGGNSETRLIAMFAGTTAFFSLFMNNLAAGALVLPSAMETSRRSGIKPSKLLIPVAYGSLLGGAATYFTTANIIVSDLLRIANPPQPTLTMLDFLPTGGLIALVGILYLAFIGKKLLPERHPGITKYFHPLSGAELEDYFQLDERLWEIEILADSRLAEKTLAETRIGEQYGLTVIGIRRKNTPVYAPAAGQKILSGDILLVVGRQERVDRLCDEGLNVVRSLQGSYLSTAGFTLVELSLTPHSNAEGKTLKELDFRNRYGFSVIALRRKDRSYRTHVGDLKLSLGDVFLVIGSSSGLDSLRNNSDFFLLEPNPAGQAVNPRKTVYTLAVVVAAITASVLGVPTYLAMLCGALALIFAGILSIEEAYRSIEWQAIFLIAGMYVASLAMIETGLAQRCGDTILLLVEPFGALGLAAGGYLLTALLTQVMGGQVTALVTGPVMISAAIQMGVNPQAIAVATAIGCSASFLTPMAHPVNILMVAPANYTFKDFTRVGWLLTLLCFLVLLIGLVLFWRL